jgi:hypothetical protein
MFAKVQDKSSNCAYRVTQEGLPILYPYLDRSKIVTVERDEFFSILSAEECVQNETFSESTQKRLSEIGSGCCVVQLREEVADAQGQKKVMWLPISAWKGKLTTRPYICKSERLHFMRLCNFDISSFGKLTSSRTTYCYLIEYN